MAEPAITTHALTKRFKQHTAVDVVDLEVPAGIVYGLLGPNGAGKTTIIHLLLGLLRSDGGAVRVLGFDPQRQGGAVRARAGALLEHNGLYERLNALQNLDFFGRINRIPPGELRARSKEALDRIGLWERRKETVGKWSKGMKQKLAIARCFLARPPLVFLDEPTAGHDPASAKELRDQLVRTVKEEGTTIFLTTHNLTEAESVCSRVGILQSGRLLAQQTPHELRSRARQARLVVEASNIKPAALAKLAELPGVVSHSHVDGRLEIDLAVGAVAAPIVAHLVKAGALVEGVRKEQATLEEAYLRLTKESP